MQPPEEYLQKTSLRAMLASLLERACKDKPDKLTPFMLEYLQYTYPDAAKEASPTTPIASFGAWTKRSDVQPTQEGLQAYLAEIKARPTLEGILEQALRKQPPNVVAFVIESLCDGGESAAAAPTGGASDAVPDAPATGGGIKTHPEAEALFDAVGEGDVDAVTELLGKGVPADVANDDGSTPLILAAEGEGSIVSVLLEKGGAAVDIQNKDGVTALLAAVKYDDPEIVGLLVAAGASRELKDVSGLSAVDHAKEGGDAAILACFGLEAEARAEPEPEPVASPKPGARRCSVSSESIDPKAKIDTSAIKVIEKDDATKGRIKESVSSSILFKALDADQMEAVIMSLEEVKVADGETIIKQSDEGNHFYIVDSGTFDCFVKKPDDGLEPPGKKVLEYKPGMTFGELALMYNTPRAASVVATSAATLWAMDRETFRTILLQMMCQKRMRFEALLETVPLLRSMEAYERTAVADAFDEQVHKQGEVILSEGSAGEAFYLIVKGTAMATKKGPEGRKSVLEYGEGDYFGELALLHNAPRTPRSLELDLQTSRASEHQPPGVLRLSRLGPQLRLTRSRPTPEQAPRPSSRRPIARASTSTEPPSTGCSARSSTS